MIDCSEQVEISSARVDAFWAHCLARLSAEGVEQDVLSAMQGLTVVLEGVDIALYAPDEKTWLQVKASLELLKHMRTSFFPEGGPKIKLFYRPIMPSSGVAPEVEANPAFDHGLNQHFVFNNFVEGPSNIYAKSAALHMVSQEHDAKQGMHNILFIYGSSGLGKTHLMHAIGNALLEQGKARKVRYVHSERFVSDMIQALQKNKMDRFKSFYRNLDALLVDDIQFFVGKCRTQEELFHTFNALFDQNQYIVLTSDRYPQELEGLEERLRSRFGWGVTVRVNAPDLETRVAILKKKSELLGAVLSEEVAFFIAQHVSSNVRELEGVLNRVMAHAQFTGSEITLDFVKQVLSDLISFKARCVSIENIKEVVVKYYHIKLSDLSSKRRNQNIVRPRQVAMYIAKQHTQMSLPEIGSYFGGRDHTTVIHAFKKISSLLVEQGEIKEDIENILKLLGI